MAWTSCGVITSCWDSLTCSFISIPMGIRTSRVIDTDGALGADVQFYLIIKESRAA